MPPKLNRAYFDEAMGLMRMKRGNRWDLGFNMLLPNAAHYIEDLMAEFEGETDPGLRCWLLELIGAARSPKALQFLIEQLAATNLAQRDWAAQGLRRLGSPEARAALREHGL